MPSIFNAHPSRTTSIDTASSGKSLADTHSSPKSASSAASSFSDLSLSNTRSSASSFHVADHACSVLHGHNALRLYGLDEASERAVRNCILQYAKEVDLLHESRLDDAGLEYKFKRRMWQNACRFTGRRCPGVEAQNFICKFLETLEKNGWQPIVVSDVGHSDVEHDSLFYRRAAPHDTKYFAIQFDEGDKLRVTAAPEDIYVGFRHIFAKNKFKEEKGDDTSLFKLAGFPLLCDHETGHKARQLFLVILDMLSAAGFELMASINMSGEGGRTSHARTWLVRRQPPLV